MRTRDKRRARSCLLLTLLVGTLVFAEGSSAADEEFLWRNPGLVSVNDRDLVFSDRPAPAARSQSVFLVARFNGGWVLMSDFFEYESPFFHRWGVYALVTDPSGRRHWSTMEMDRSRMRVDPNRLMVTDGTNTFEGAAGSYHLVLRLTGFACDLEVRGLLPAWQGGDGVDTFTPDGRMYLQRSLPCPWGELNGRMQIDGESIVVHGDALLERTTRVAPLDRQYESLRSARAWSDEAAQGADRWFLELFDITANRSYGSARIPRLAVARGGEWLFTTPAYTLVAADPEPVPGVGYPVPRLLKVSATASGFVADLEYRALILFDITDIIEEVPPYLRLIVRLFFRRPVYVRFLGEVHGTITYPDGHVETIELSGPYEYVILQ